MSAVSSVFDFLTECLRFVTGIFSGKKEDKKNLWAEILDRRAQLSVALAEGRITDVMVLRKELDSLMKQYSRHIRSEEKSLIRARKGNPLAFSAVVAAVIVFSGCVHGKSGSQQTLVIGERINIVKPGSEITVPELTPPAKTWYLIDNIAIQQWLGIPVDYSQDSSK